MKSFLSQTGVGKNNAEVPTEKREKNYTSEIATNFKGTFLLYTKWLFFFHVV